MVSPIGRIFNSVARIFVDRPQTPTSATTLVPVIARYPLKQGRVPYRFTGLGIVPPRHISPWSNAGKVPYAQPNNQTTGMAWASVAQAQFSLPASVLQPNVTVL